MDCREGCGSVMEVKSRDKIDPLRGIEMLLYLSGIIDPLSLETLEIGVLISTELNFFVWIVLLIFILLFYS